MTLSRPTLVICTDQRLGIAPTALSLTHIKDRLPNAALKYFAILRLYAPTEATFDETTSRRSGDRG